eukprot:scaffold110978_cov17-Tisochrysis_lutea.AAC.2
MSTTACFYTLTHRSWAASPHAAHLQADLAHGTFSVTNGGARASGSAFNTCCSCRRSCGGSRACTTQA